MSSFASLNMSEKDLGTCVVEVHTSLFPKAQPLCVTDNVLCMVLQDDFMGGRPGADFSKYLSIPDGCQLFAACSSHVSSWCDPE